VSEDAPSIPGSRALLDVGGIDQFRSALAPYTPEAIAEALGPVGCAALSRVDLDGVRRALPAGELISTLITLFLLGGTVTEREARAALGTLPLDAAADAGLVACSTGSVRALLEVSPHQAPAGDPAWWVVSDLGSAVRPGPVAADHVLGVGSAARTLAQATIREPVARAVDIGTGCGIQALHLSTHAQAVTATDISERALRYAATTAALSGRSWDLRSGSLLDPVAGERFDLVVANPPFVVSAGLRPGAGGYEYRDSGLAGDDLCHRLVNALPDVLAPGGVAQLLANWVIPTGEDEWADRVTGWLAGRGCDAWFWQREVADLGEYVTLWLGDAGGRPGTPEWSQRYDQWMDWFAASGVAAVGMGLVTLWQTDREPVIVCEDVPQPLDQPIGAHLPGWISRQRWLATISDADLLATPLRRAGGLRRTEFAVVAADGWRAERLELGQTHGMCWQIEIDEAVASLVAGCDGTAPVQLLCGLLAASIGAALVPVVDALLPTVRELVANGFLEPPAAAPVGTSR